MPESDLSKHPVVDLMRLGRTLTVIEGCLRDFSEEHLIEDLTIHRLGLNRFYNGERLEMSEVDAAIELANLSHEKIGEAEQLALRFSEPAADEALESLVGAGEIIWGAISGTEASLVMQADYEVVPALCRAHEEAFEKYGWALEQSANRIAVRAMRLTPNGVPQMPLMSDVRPPVNQGDTGRDVDSSIIASLLRAITACGKDAKPDMVIATAGVGSKRGRDLLRRLEEDGKYSGFARNRPRRFRGR
ncbi:MAG: hypothetical protein JNM56_23775 [Planctomycetia bacterium]|nr:hypothetical protein [Planctomycetia bacterium]